MMVLSDIFLQMRGRRNTMANIVKCYKQQIPATRFIGKKYGDSDRVDGMFGKHWGDWFANGWFDVIEKQLDGQSLKSVYEDGDAYIGLMRCKEGEPFEYWIGIFMPQGTEVPDGYDSIDFDAAALGVAWIKGPEAELYGHEDECFQRMEQENMHMLPDKAGAWWFFERYGCPRFTTPDENGHVTLDICAFVD